MPPDRSELIALLAGRTDPGEPPPCIPDHEVLRRIGRGSYGEVWLARNLMGVYRAVKVVHRKTFEQDRPFEREFEGIRKCEPISRSHPGHVSILHVGRNHEEGCFFYVMELADDETSGQNINPSTYRPKTLKGELARRGRLPNHDALEISLSLAGALDHLHSHHLIHRDIKPANIIFISGVAKLADIGLVTDMGETVSFVGTVGYLPPEGPGTPSADIFGLGKVLYQVCTGKQAQDFPELPAFMGQSEENRELLELNLVFLKACQNDPRQRYQSAREMHADLALLHGGKSLKRARLLERRLVQFKRAAAICAGVAVMVVAAFYMLEQRRVANLQREIELQRQSEQMARRLAESTRDRLVHVYLGNARRAESSGDTFAALVWLAQALEESPPADEAIQLRAQIRELWSKAPVIENTLAHSSEERTPALASGRFLAAFSGAQSVRIVDLAGEAFPTVGIDLPEPIQVVAINGVGGQVFTATALGTAQLWKTARGTLLPPTPLPHAATIAHASFDGSGANLQTTAGNQVHLWNTATGRLRATFEHSEPAGVSVFSPDGLMLAVAEGNTAVRLWKTETGRGGKEPLVLNLSHASTRTQEQNAGIQSIAFSADSRKVIVCRGVQARVFHAGSGESAHYTLHHEGLIRSAGFSPDGKLIVTVGNDRMARVWGAISGALLFALPHAAPVVHGSFSPDGRWLATLSGNESRLWNARTGAPAFAPVFHPDELIDGQFSLNSGRFISTSKTSVRMAGLKGVEGSALEALAPPELTKLFSNQAARRLGGAGSLEWIDAEELQQEAAASGKIPGNSIDALQWHALTAEERERAGDWFAARFHWDQALAFTPQDREWRRRRDLAAENLDATGNLLAISAPAATFLPRPPEAKPQSIDLSGFYNARLTSAWSGIGLNADLSGLGTGIRRVSSGTEFDVRGLIQLAGSSLENAGAQWPVKTSGIPIGQRCGGIHFLHGASGDDLFGTRIGTYEIHYENGTVREVAIHFGQHVRNWLSFASQPQPTPGASLIAVDPGPQARAAGLALRVYEMEWTNPLPDQSIERIHFVSRVEKAAPFLIAITVR